MKNARILETLERKRENTTKSSASFSYLKFKIWQVRYTI